MDRAALGALLVQQVIPAASVMQATPAIMALVVQAALLVQRVIREMLAVLVKQAVAVAVAADRALRIHRETLARRGPQDLSQVAVLTVTAVPAVQSAA
jgi:hypothetical protein